jgi:two-component system, OmpR family, response regulator
MINILMLESGTENANVVESSFRRSKYSVTRMRMEDASIEQFKNPLFKLIIVDIDLKTKASQDLITQLHHFEGMAPVLFLCPQTAIDSIAPYLLANEFDFMLKPLSVLELKARAKTLLRKTSDLFERFQLRSSGVILDLTSRKAYRGETQITLQTNEFELLAFLMKNAGRVISKTEILEKVWNYSFDPQTNIVDVLVSRLRSKIDRQFSNKVIQTVRGVGYIFRPV